MAFWDDIAQALADLIDQVSNLTTNIQAGVTSSLDILMDDLTSAILEVSNGLTDIEKDVIDSLNDIALDITGKLQTAISSVATTLGSVTATVNGYVSQGLSYVLGLVNAIQTDLSGALTEGLTTVSNIVSGIEQGLTDAIASVQAEVSQVINEVSLTLSGTVATLQNGLSSLQTVITQTLNPMNLVNGAGDKLHEWQSLVTEAINGRIRLKQNALDRIMKGEVSSFQELVSLIGDPPEADNPITGLGDLFYTLAGILFASQAIAGIYARETIQMHNAHHPTEVISPEVLANMEIQNVINREQGVTEAAYSGVNRARYEQMVLLAGSPPGGETVLEMLNRGDLTEQEARDAILESRLKPKYTESFLKLRDLIPSANDLIQFAVKDAFDPDAVSRFQLNEQFPEEILEWTRKKGLSEEWTKKYWAAHWRLPSVEQVFEMLWRSPETGITPEDVDRFLKVDDISPFWRDKLKAITYKVFTRVDVRRMYKVGILDYAGVVRAYLDMGYDQKRAEALADFTVKLEDETGYLNPDNQERRLWNQAVDLYMKGARTESDLRALGGKFGWKAAGLENEITIAKERLEEYNLGAGKEKELLNPETLSRRIIDETANLYVKGHRPLDALGATMRQMGIDEDAIKAELLIATLRKEGATKPDKVEELRDLSINAILDAFELHAITESEAQTKLTDIGLSEKDAKLELEVNKLQAASKLKQTIISSIRSAFLAGLINESKVRESLAKYGFPATEAENYLNAWTLERDLKHKSFTEAQLAAFLKKEIIDLAQYKAELTELGYSAVQVEWLSKLRGESE